MKKHFIKHLENLLLLLSCSWLIACSEQSSKNQNMGPAYNVDQIDEALQKASGNEDPYSIYEGEFVYTEVTQALKNLQTSLLEQNAITVTQRIETESEIKLTLVREIKDYRSKPEKHWMDEKEFIVRKALKTLNKIFDYSNPDLNAPLSTPDNSSISLSPRSLISLKFNEEDSTRVTYHNLKVIESSEAPPEAVRQQENCGEIPNCTIHVSQVSYDLVVWKSDTQNDKYSVVKKISYDVPFLAKVLDHCQQTSVPIQDQRVVVTMCSRVKNFKFGHKTNP